MKIVAIGGSGLIGKKLVPILRQRGHEAVVASRSSGVDVLTGAGLAAAMAGADVVVDVSNSPSWEDAAVMAFFDVSTRNLLAAEKAAGVRHHVALSVAGADRLPDSGYMRAKVNQEKLIAAGGVPYTVVRAAVLRVPRGYRRVGWRRPPVPDGPTQPVAADDVATGMADAAVSPPLNAIVDLAGPESLSIAEFMGRFLAASGDKRPVVADPQATYFGAARVRPGAEPRGEPAARADPVRWVGGPRRPEGVRCSRAAAKGRVRVRGAVGRSGRATRPGAARRRTDRPLAGRDGAGPATRMTSPRVSFGTPVSAARRRPSSRVRLPG